MKKKMMKKSAAKKSAPKKMMKKSAPARKAPMAPPMAPPMPPMAQQGPPPGPEGSQTAQMMAKFGGKKKAMKKYKTGGATGTPAKRVGGIRAYGAVQGKKKGANS